MAISANTLIEVRAGGSDTANGGAFVTGASGTDRSLQDAAHATLSTSSVVNSTTTKIDVDSGDYTVIAADVGNFLQITGGTATAGFYEITAVDTVASPKTWTLDRSVGTAGQTVIGGMGGALATLGMAGSFMDSVGVTGNGIWQKSGTYGLTSASNNVAGGAFTLGDSSKEGLFLRGYETTRGDHAARPDNVVGAQTGITVVTSGNTSAATAQLIDNISVDGNSQSNIIGFDASDNYEMTGVNCKAVDCTTGFKNGTWFHCHAITCTVGFNSRSSNRCDADGCTTGFLVISVNGGNTSSCIAHDGGVGFNVPIRESLSTCTAVNNSGDGFQLVDSSKVLDCVSALNGGYGFDGGSTSALGVNCFSHSNSSGASTDDARFDITALTDPFVDETSKDYRPNAIVGGGDSLRNITGPPGQSQNMDAGAVQQSAGGGGGLLVHPGMAGGISA